MAAHLTRIVWALVAWLGLSVLFTYQHGMWLSFLLVGLGTLGLIGIYVWINWLPLLNLLGRGLQWWGDRRMRQTAKRPRLLLDIKDQREFRVTTYEIVHRLVSFRTDLHREIRLWCKDTLGYVPEIAPKYSGTVLSPRYLIFRTENDAFHFKMRWW